SRDRAGDDFSRYLQALRARVDQPGAELRQIEDARHQSDEAGEIERNNPARQAGKRQREEKLPGADQPIQRDLPGLAARAIGSRIVREGRRRVLVVQIRIWQRSIEQWLNLRVVAERPAKCFRAILSETGCRRQLTMKQTV